MEITKEIAKQMKDSGIKSLVNTAKEAFPELFYEFHKNNYVIRLLNHSSFPRFNEHLIEITTRNGFTTEDENYLSLCIRMRDYTKYINELDNFVPDWDDEKEFKHGIGMSKYEAGTSYCDFSKFSLFDCYFKTKDRAEECLELFREEIEEVFDLEDRKIL